MKEVGIYFLAKKEFAEFLQELKFRGLKQGPSLALILGRWCEQFEDVSAAVDAVQGLWRDYHGKPMEDEPELDLTQK
jgi:hypothetical protein